MRLVPLLALLLAAPTLAQPQFGLKAGTAVSWLASDAESPTRLGLVIGGTVALPLSPTLAVQAEALYVEKGEGPPEGERDSARNRRTFVELPVALVAHGPAGTRVLAGGFVAQGVTDDVGQRGGGGELDVGVLAGVGVARGALGLDVRAEIGLRNLSPVETAPRLSTRSVTLTLGYRLGR